MASDCCATPSPTDAKKRVDYSYGLVLGVAEFRTEQGYFLGKHRGHARALHGYGTVSGLAVSALGSEVRVSPGLALDPQGREICVPEPQCARLEDWLAQRLADGDLSPPLGLSPPGPMTAYVVLCYRECETERVPVPAGPCLSLDRSTAPSRIQDAFELAIVDAPPPQVEETAIRILGDVLGHVRVEAGPGALTDAGPLLAEIRGLLEASPPVAPASPPADLALDPGHAGAILREAFRVWVTEVRPQLVPEGGGCLGGPRDPSCVLLARLDFGVKLVSGVPLVDGPVAVDDSQRPVLVETRLLQELLAPSTGTAEVGGGVATGGATYAASLSLPAGAATPVAPTSPVLVNNALPALSFSAGSSAVNVATLPRDLAPGGPLAVRLNWGTTSTTPSSGTLFTVTVRFIASGDGVSGVSSSQTVNVPAPAGWPAKATVAVSGLVALGVSPPPGAALVSVTVQAAVAGLLLYCTELQYAGQGSTP
ncbi:MAG TPA: hypothetical protein VLU43_14945 [Anaeromyxobacteraceae bacterium]|nr:hypothetical protein [Anaeromyxobacteraceae bacterium]